MLVAAMVGAGAAAAGAHHSAQVEELVEAAITEAEVTRTTTSLATHVATTIPSTELRRFVAKRLLKQMTSTASLPSSLDFATCSSRRNSNLS
jgi:3-hydroxyacyl-CoA dehydrogenase